MNFYGGNGKDEENADEQKSLFRAMEFDGSVPSTEGPPRLSDRLVSNGIPPVPFQPNLLADGHGKWLFSLYPMDESKKSEWHPEFSAGRKSGWHPDAAPGMGETNATSRNIPNWTESEERLCP